jgi:hypothetical protein
MMVFDPSTNRHDFIYCSGLRDLMDYVLLEILMVGLQFRTLVRFRPGIVNPLYLVHGIINSAERAVRNLQFRTLINRVCNPDFVNAVYLTV